MFHLMSSDNWLAQYILQGQVPAPDDPAAPQQTDYPDRASLRAGWDDVEQELTGVVTALSDKQWNETLTLPSGNDDTFATTLGELFVTNVNHGTNHRAQVLALINELGGHTVEQGFYFYLLQR